MAKSGNVKSMRGRIVSGSDGSCGCCSAWGETRASFKRELELDAREGLEEYMNYRKDESDFHTECEIACLKNEEEKGKNEY